MKYGSFEPGCALNPQREIMRIFLFWFGIFLFSRENHEKEIIKKIICNHDSHF